MSSEAETEFLSRTEGNESVAMAKLEKQINELERRVDEALVDEANALPAKQPAKPGEVRVWGVPFSKLTLAETLQHIEQLISWGEPGYFITANLNYNMLTSRVDRLEQVNRDASFIVCDGMPMVAWSKLVGDPLPERVAGSELIYALTKWAAIKDHRIFFLGGAPGVAQRAADKLSERYPGLQVAGVESPPFRPLSEEEESAMIQRIKDSQADIVYVALGQPKGELWMHKHFRDIGAPVCVQIGASFDFVAGGVLRAPVWVQKIGMEWFYRMVQEPRRLFGRYWQNGMFLLAIVSKELLLRAGRLVLKR